MKTALLFHTDSYAREFDAEVLEVREVSTPEGAVKSALILDRTLFYYTGGGQPCDMGKIEVNGADGSVQAYNVVEVRKVEGEVLHYIDRAPSPPLAVGAKVHGTIDWERRYRLMRVHTAGHVLSTVMFSKGALITGNQLGVQESRFDFSLENFDRALIEKMVEEANAKLAEKLAVKVYFMPREEALKLPGMVKLAVALPPEISELRIVDIGGFDVQADGGTHVKNTEECGKLKLTKMENKGKANRRIYFCLDV